MKIGFYGDSFCCELSNFHSISKGYNTYIKKIKDYYNADIVHLGIGGSSVWDVILQQFNENDIPDISIFCWTDYNRLYNKNLRNLTYSGIKNKKIKDLRIKDLIYYNTISAAEKYFEYLHDIDKSKIEHSAAMQYFDLNVLSKTNSIIIHMWSFEKYYDWTTGTSIDIPLKNFINGSDLAANHLDGNNSNEQVFQLLKNIIDDRRQL